MKCFNVSSARDNAEVPLTLSSLLFESQFDPVAETSESSSHITLKSYTMHSEVPLCCSGGAACGCAQRTFSMICCVA